MRAGCWAACSPLISLTHCVIAAAALPAAVVVIVLIAVDVAGLPLYISFFLRKHWSVTHSEACWLELCSLCVSQLSSCCDHVSCSSSAHCVCLIVAALVSLSDPQASDLERRCAGQTLLRHAL